MAPEVVVVTGHDLAADWWALGVLTIELLTTFVPFGTNETHNGNEMMERITNEHPLMPTNISTEMTNFISKMLTKDPKKRLGGSNALATEIKQHPLFNGFDWEKLEKKQLPTPQIPDIADECDTKNFNDDFTQQPAKYEPSAVPPNTFQMFAGYSYIPHGLDATQLDIDINDSIAENWKLWRSNDNQTALCSTKIKLNNETWTDLSVKIDGEPNTPYEGGTFVVGIKASETYPFNQPKVRFLTKIWHPNISSVTGVVCLDILKEWTPTTRLTRLLSSLLALLSTPEPNDPQDTVVAWQFQENCEMFALTAKHWTNVYAGGPHRIADCDEKIQRLKDMGRQEEEACALLSAQNWNLEKVIENLDIILLLL